MRATTTTEDLAHRQRATVDTLPPPVDEAYVSAVVAVPDDVLARSTWRPECPVTREELRYVTVSFVGFDGGFHTGELLVHADAAEAVVEVFRQLHAARFPLEEMRITRLEELDAPPHGDGNNTSAFVCRNAVGSTNWSQHAYGRAIDVNPFQNPYDKLATEGIVLPEKAIPYLDRTDVRPGMFFPGDAVTTAFASVGWKWGGDYRTFKDWHHFSANGR